ncbi:hypothetical protein [Glutamicibacter sp. X7]
MPPIPEFLGGPNGWLFWVCALVLIGGLLWKPVKGFARIIKAVAKVAEDWNGTEDRVDKSGAVVEKGRPGVPALLETVRAQVQNSHSANLRDDVDKVIDISEQNATAIRHLAAKLDQHIVIAKESDQRQDETAAKVDRLVEKYAKE